MVNLNRALLNLLGSSLSGIGDGTLEIVLDKYDIPKAPIYATKGIIGTSLSFVDAPVVEGIAQGMVYDTTSKGLKTFYDYYFNNNNNNGNDEENECPDVNVNVNVNQNTPENSRVSGFFDSKIIQVGKTGRLEIDALNNKYNFYLDDVLTDSVDVEEISNMFQIDNIILAQNQSTKVDMDVKMERYVDGKYYSYERYEEHDFSYSSFVYDEENKVTHFAKARFSFTNIGINNADVTVMAIINNILAQP